MNGGNSMPLELYHAETVQTAKEQSAALDEARDKLISGILLSRLEENGVLHAYQVLIENAIGKAKQLLKAENEPVPVSAYDAFVSLVRIKKVSSEDLTAWNATIGLRNRIVHEYMNIDINIVLELVRDQRHQFVIDFLLTPIDKILEDG